METLANLEAFVRTARTGSFSQAGRRLGLTAAAVSRNVAVLEKNLGKRLFRRSTRKLSLTDAGEQLLLAIEGPLDALGVAIANASDNDDAPAGVLKVSMSPSIGIAQFLPLLPAFMSRYPSITPEWHFENRIVDIVEEDYDVAIGGGFDLRPGLVAHRLAPVHVVAVASPDYMRGKKSPRDPSELAGLSGIFKRSPHTGRIRHWALRDASGAEVNEALDETLIVNDPAAMREAARLGLGVAFIATLDIVPDLESGRLVRLIPDWYADAGAFSIYYSSRILVPSRIRVFVDFVVDAFRSQRLDARFSAASE